MTMRFGIDLKGEEKTILKLQKLANGITGKDVLQAIAEDIKEVADKYPPESSANMPGRAGGWYERGYGPRWSGGSGGRRTSEVLGKQWVAKARDNLAIIANRASYAIFVQGDKQASFHEKRGWKKLEDVAEEHLPEATRKIARQIGRIIR